MDHVSVRSSGSRAAVRALAAIVLLGALLIAPRAARAGGTLDQTSPTPMGVMGAAFNAGPSSLIWQAQIKAGLAGQLAGVTLELEGVMGSQIEIRVRMGAAPSAQPALFDQIVTKTTDISVIQPLFVDMTSVSIPLVVGDLFALEIQGNNTGGGFAGSYIAPPGTPLYPQPLYVDGAPNGDGGWRMGFMTYVLTATCAAGTPCDDGDPCTTNDVCDATGFCSGTPLVCPPPPDDCHQMGVCASGTCSWAPLPDGTACDDGNACTQTDTCQVGVCVGMDPVVCLTSLPCLMDGTCDPATGVCGAPPPVADGTPCDDGNACTRDDACKAGACVGDPIACAAAPCQEVGTCDPGSGTCSSTPSPDGTPCTGGTCMGGGCVSSTTAGSGGAGGGSGGGSSGGAGGGTSTSSSSGVGGDGGTGGGGSGTASQPAGCGCRSGRAPEDGAPLAVIGLAAILARRRFQRRARGAVPIGAALR